MPRICWLRIHPAFTLIREERCRGQKGWDLMLVDELRLRALREEVGDDGYEEVLALFLAEGDDVVDRLSRHADGSVPADELHFLKGIALNLGLDDLAALCRRGERGDGFDPAALSATYAETRVAIEMMGDG
jgi:hypothetical protein